MPELRRPVRHQQRQPLPSEQQPRPGHHLGRLDLQGRRPGAVQRDRSLPAGDLQQPQGHDRRHRTFPGRIQFDVDARPTGHRVRRRWRRARVGRGLDRALRRLRADTSDEDDDSLNTSVPFQVAYAVSIHKAQGLEYDSVKVVITDANEDDITHNIFYTAITRAREQPADLLDAGDPTGRAQQPQPRRESKGCGTTVEPAQPFTVALDRRPEFAGQISGDWCRLASS